MKKLIIAATTLAAITAATPAAAQVVSSNPRATASARLIKPLTLTAVQNLNFGTIVMGTLTGDDVVSISSAGVVACGTSTNLACSGSPQAAQFRITGTQGQVVVVSSSAASFALTGSNGGSLAFVPSLPAVPITLGNSGAPGNSFNVGGSITIGTATLDGVYSGQIDVQVAYQ